VIAIVDGAPGHGPAIVVAERYTLARPIEALTCEALMATDWCVLT
jgi:hypothetical protein